MSSNIKIKRICEHCSAEFIAKTTLTRFCSPLCTKRAYKAKLRGEKIAQAVSNVQMQQNKPIEIINAKQIMTVKDAAQLLDCTTRAIRHMIKEGRIKAQRLSQRQTRIQRSEIDRLFDQPMYEYVSLEKPIEEKLRPLKRDECYTIVEVQRKYGIPDYTLYRVLLKHKVRKQPAGVHTLVPKADIDRILKDYVRLTRGERKPKQQPVDRNKYYTIGEMEHVFGLSPATIYVVLKQNNVVKERNGKFVIVRKETADKLFTHYNAGLG